VRRETFREAGETMKANADAAFGSFARWAGTSILVNNSGSARAGCAGYAGWLRNPGALIEHRTVQ